MKKNRSKRCRHRWLRKFTENKNALGDLALFEVWYCGKCKIETEGEFKGAIESTKKNKELKEKINPREFAKRSKKE